MRFDLSRTVGTANIVSGDSRDERSTLIGGSFFAAAHGARLGGRRVSPKAVQMAIIYPSKTTVTDSM